MKYRIREWMGRWEVIELQGPKFVECETRKTSTITVLGQALAATMRLFTLL
jgi:hypothetical protein